MAPTDLLRHWGGGFWRLLEFGMQVAFTLVTGFALAHAPPVSRALEWLSERPVGTRSGVALVSAAAVLAALANWAFGLIVGGVLARRVAERLQANNRPVHYPLLGAAGYAGLLVWHGGLSGSAPLKVAEEGHFLAGQIGLLSTGETLGSTMNILLTAVLIVAVPLFFVLLCPKGSGGERGEGPPQNRPLPGREPDGEERGLAARLNRSRAIGIGFAAAGLSSAGVHFARGGGLDLNTINFLFLFLGLLLHQTPQRFLRAAMEGMRGASGIILQFPLYAGILGILEGSGLVERISSLFVSISNGTTLPLFTFLAAGGVNLFIPSGGGQWVVQGEIMCTAAQELSVSFPKIVMAVAYGDEWTNMLQPFWALPLLAITGLKAREIIGYTATVMLLTGGLYVGALLLLPA